MRLRCLLPTHAPHLPFFLLPADKYLLFLRTWLLTSLLLKDKDICSASTANIHKMFAGGALFPAFMLIVIYDSAKRAVSFKCLLSLFAIMRWHSAILFITRYSPLPHFCTSGSS